MPPVKISRDSPRIAIHLQDVDRLETKLRHMLLHGRLDLKNVMRVGEEPALRFICPLREAALICDHLRTICLQCKHDQARLYVRRGDGDEWCALPPGTALTGLIGGTIEVLAEVFRMPSSSSLAPAREGVGDFDR